MTSIAARVRIPKDVLFQDLDGEAVLLNMQSGKYFGLDPIGTRIWNLLIEHGSLAIAYQSVLDEYDVDPDRLRFDFLALVDQLAMNGLIELDEHVNTHES
jgi:hypothetical protein